MVVAIVQTTYPVSYGNIGNISVILNIYRLAFIFTSITYN